MYDFYEQIEEKITVFNDNFFENSRNYCTNVTLIVFSCRFRKDNFGFDTYSKPRSFRIVALFQHDKSNIIQIQLKKICFPNNLRVISSGAQFQQKWRRFFKNYIFQTKFSRRLREISAFLLLFS